MIWGALPVNQEYSGWSESFRACWDKAPFPLGIPSCRGIMRWCSYLDQISNEIWMSRLWDACSWRCVQEKPRDMACFDCLSTWFHCDKGRTQVMEKIAEDSADWAVWIPTVLPHHCPKQTDKVLRRNQLLCFSFMWNFSESADEAKLSKYYLHFGLFFCFEISFQLYSLRSFLFIAIIIFIDLEVLPFSVLLTTFFFLWSYKMFHSVQRTYVKRAQVNSYVWPSPTCLCSAVSASPEIHVFSCSLLLPLLFPSFGYWDEGNLVTENESPGTASSCFFSLYCFIVAVIYYLLFGLCTGSQVSSCWRLWSRKTFWRWEE